MALDLKRWVLGTLAACLITAVAGLAGGGHSVSAPETAPQRPATRWAAEASRLGNEWRATSQSLRMETYRDELVKPADSARAAGGTAPLLLVDGPSTAAQRTELRGYLAELWHGAAPEGFKVAVALVIDRTTDPSGSKFPPGRPGQSTRYLFPDSLHRDLCVAVVHDEYRAARFFDPRRTQPLGLGRESNWLVQGLGPCAFYGAFGIPSRDVGGWIAGLGHQFAMYPQWWITGNNRFTGWWWDEKLPIARQGIQWWGSLYTTLPWAGVACYADRPGSCAAAVYDTSAVSETQPASWDSFQWWREQVLFGSPYYLSDLARSLGPSRFSQFWTADVPVDSAMHLASGETLDKLTSDWAHRGGLHVRLGPSAPFLDILSGLLPALLALGAAVWYAGRRQIG